MYTDINRYSVPITCSVREAVARMELGRIGIVLILHSNGKLAGMLTDGDVRRAVLANFSFEKSVSTLLEKIAKSKNTQPITAPEGTNRDTLLKILKDNQILHLPLVDSNQRVVSLVTMNEFVPNHGDPPAQAIIMAGGRGMRLRPLTDDIPKPMLPVGEQPLMRHTVEQLRNAGVKRVSVTVHHKSDVITDFFGDGQDFGLDISYVSEDRPLGTAGALALMEAPKETTLVINGDILTRVDFGALMAYHREQAAEMTIAVQNHDIQVDYGLVEVDGSQVTGISEKPVLNFFINAGIYVLEPSIYQLIPAGKRFDMTDLIQNLLDNNRPISAFPIREYWLDVGAQIDYEQANRDVNLWSADVELDR